MDFGAKPFYPEQEWRKIDLRGPFILHMNRQKPSSAWISLKEGEFPDSCSVFVRVLSSHLVYIDIVYI